MITQATISDYPAIDSFDPFKGDRREDISENRVFVYKHEGIVHGFISMARAGLLGRPYVQFLAVDRAYQRTGIASKLLDYVEELYSEERLFISTESDNVNMQALLEDRQYEFSGEIVGANLNQTNELYYFKEKNA